MNAPVFLDTVGLLAVWDKSDQWHTPATRAYEKLLRSAAPAYSTSFVFLELGNAAARKPFRPAVGMLRGELERKGRLLYPSPEDWSLAWEEYRKGDVYSPGIVDVFSFRAMKQAGIDRAFTNDRHFAAAGFELLF